MKKNFRLYKKIGLLTGGIVLTESFLYGVATITTGINPLKPNQAKAYKVYSSEYTKDGILDDERYICDESALNYHLKITTPYYETGNGEFRQDTYAVRAIPDKETEDYIIKNIRNQELILEEPYVEEKILDLIQNNNSSCYYALDSKASNMIPDNNNYEVSYTTFEIDKNDITMVSIPKQKLDDIKALYGTSSVLLLFPYMIEVSNILSEDKSSNKQKKLKKVIKSDN